MIYRKPCPEGTSLWARTYKFLEPVQIRLRHPDGSTSLMGYGIGDSVQVLEPTTYYPICCLDRLREILLADGSIMIEFPKNMRYE